MQRYNASNVDVKRDLKSIQDRIKNCKDQARKFGSKVRLNKTGGGPAPSEEPVFIMKMFDIISGRSGDSVRGIGSGIESSSSNLSRYDICASVWVHFITSNFITYVSSPPTSSPTILSPTHFITSHFITYPFHHLPFYHLLFYRKTFFNKFYINILLYQTNIISNLDKSVFINKHALPEKSSKNT